MTMMTDRRSGQRRRTLLGGTARFAVLTGTMSCVVRNLSESGARLEMEHTLWIPGHFELDIPHLDKRLGARVVWRQPKALGIAFEEHMPRFLRRAKPRAHQTSIKGEDRVRYLEKERARLELRVKQLTDEL